MPLQKNWRRRFKASADRRPKRMFAKKGTKPVCPATGLHIRESVIGGVQHHGQVSGVDFLQGWSYCISILSGKFAGANAGEADNFGSGQCCLAQSRKSKLVQHQASVFTTLFTGFEFRRTHLEISERTWLCPLVDQESGTTTRTPFGSTAEDHGEPEPGKDSVCL